MIKDPYCPKCGTVWTQCICPNDDGGSDQRLVRLPVGAIIQRGDKFLSDDGRCLEMDNLGRLLGVRCLGQVLKKAGSWFRKPNAQSAAARNNNQPTATHAD